MDASFFRGNRQRFADLLPDGTMAVFFSGGLLHQSADAYYPFYANRNYLYLAGVDFPGLVLTVSKVQGQIAETLYILPPDHLTERWEGRRFSQDEVKAISGCSDVRHLEAFDQDFVRSLDSGQIGQIMLDLFKRRVTDQETTAEQFAAKLKKSYTGVEVVSSEALLRRLRTIKQPCEIEAIRQAETITGAGIKAMMKAARAGILEYELRAEFDYVLAGKNAMHAFFPIISAGRNNFFIHYEGKDGVANDGDMILVDVGAAFENMASDVSRGFPCNGTFSREQRVLYEAAFRTSNHLFEKIRPGFLMRDVDATVRLLLCEELKQLGLVRDIDDVDRCVWHGGAHHVGWDVHDMVARDIEKVEPGMVFCVDVGIYCEAWGIGFRLEDNCLVTRTGAKNLSQAIPRSVEQIEAIMRER